MLTGCLSIGWDGKIDQRDVALNKEQATFHPTKYMVGVLKWLAEQPNFSCYTHTRVMSVEEKGIEVLGIGSKDVRVSTEEGFTVTCKNALEATCVPLQKLSVVAQMGMCFQGIGPTFSLSFARPNMFRAQSAINYALQSTLCPKTMLISNSQ